MRQTEVIVNDEMQVGYRYLLTAPMGTDFATDFTPELTPKEMLNFGVFEGKYMTDCGGEFPADWFEGAKLSPEKADIQMNYFKIKSRQPLSVWHQKGWIYGPDPRGWFQWYLSVLYGAPIARGRCYSN